MEIFLAFNPGSLPLSLSATELFEDGKNNTVCWVVP